jgi:hypothetical protein
MGMGGSDVEQQAQYHPRGVSSALLFTINASVLVPALPVFGSCSLWGPGRQFQTQGAEATWRSLATSCRMPRATCPFLQCTSMRGIVRALHGMRCRGRGLGRRDDPR